MTTPITDEADAPQPVTGLRREPAMVTAAVTAVVAVLALFGVHVSDATTEQVTAVVTALAIVAPVVQGIVTRAKVTPTATVAAATDTAGVVRSGPADHTNDTGAPVAVASSTVPASSEVEGA